MRIALAQFNPTVADFAGNTARILALAGEAKQRGAELVVFSELCVCGYPPLDLLERPAFVARNRAELERLAAAGAGLPAMVVGYVGPAPPDPAGEATGRPISNCAAVLAGGRVVFEQRKMLLPTYDVFDESRHFQPAAAQQVFEFSPAGAGKGTAPLLGITVCEDIWNDKEFWVPQPGSRRRSSGRLYERDPVAELMQQVPKGRDAVLLNLSSSPYNLDKRGLRLEMLRALARRHGRPVVYVNQVGGNDSLVFDGSSVALTAEGRVAAQARSFEEDLVIFDTATGEGDIREQPQDELETAYRALVCGTRDYVRKCGFARVVVGLSGGIDSAVVAALAAEALGPANVLGAGMPGPFSSAGSLTDAQQLARNLGIEFVVLPVHDLYDAYLRALEPAFRGLPRDVTEENIQARIRGNLLMALSNKTGSLVLSTGNKSELAVGYCTLYGDMAGGLAVISDVPKTMVYELARLINRSREVIPAATIAKPPSAELRPHQTDQDTLPPYDVLDRILKAYVEEMRSPREIADDFGLDFQLVSDVAARVDRSEYKRKQAAPGLRITSKAFTVGRMVPVAKKTGC